MKAIDINKLKEEANRCFLCKVPKCKKYCPIDTQIPAVIQLFKENKIDEAGEILFNNNPLSAICGVVCPHEDQCLGNCIRGIKDEPVNFYEIESFISREYLKNTKLKQENKLNERIAIIGSGPAGISLALILAKKGYKVTIFEKRSHIGGVLRYGIPKFRLPVGVLDDIENMLLDLNVKIRYNALVGPVITIDKLFEDGYDAIFIGTGVWNPNTLHIKGETFGNVHFGINYLNNPDSYKLGKRVIVIGAGNAAMDVARTAIRKGVRYLTCFSITKEVAASQYEYSYAKLEGVEFEYNKRPVEIKDNGVIFRDIIENEDGSFTDVEGTDKLYESDSVIISISQGPMTRLVNTTKGLNANKRGLLEADETGHTSRPGIFASGDVVNGARTVVEAVAHSKIVAESMHAYMQSLDEA